MNKRGLSTVIVTVILILISILAIVIFWLAIKPIIERSNDASASCFIIQLNMEKVNIQGNNLNITVHRAAGKGNLTGFKLIITNYTDNEVYINLTEIKELETKNFIMPLNITNMKKIELYGLINDRDRIRTCEVSDIKEYNISINNNPNNPNPNCGDGVCNSDETCSQDNNYCVNNVPECKLPDGASCTNGCVYLNNKVKETPCSGGLGECDGLGNCILYDLNKDLISYYKFENNVNDEKNNNNGIISENTPWSIQNIMNVLPENSGWLWQVHKTSGGSISLNSNSPQELIINSAGTEPYNYYKYNGLTSLFGFNNGFTVEFRMKAQISGDSTNVLYAWNGNYWTGLIFNIDGHSVGLPVLNGVPSYVDIGDSSQYHIYRITVKNSEVKLYVDNVFISSATPVYSPSSQNLLEFGDVESGPGPTILVYDYFQFYYGEKKAPNFINGISGKGMSFDGVDDYIDLGNSNNFNPNSNLSLSAWIKINQNKDFNTIIRRGWTLSKDPGTWTIYSNSGRSVNFGIVDGYNDIKIILSDDKITENRWYHIAGTYNGTMMKIYFDGNLQNQRIYTINLDNSKQVTIGGLGGTGNEYLNATIDNVRIYNRNLRKGEILLINNTKQ